MNEVLEKVTVENWEIINLGNAATFVNGYAFKPTDWSDNGLEIIRIQNLTKSSKQVNYYRGEIDEKYKIKKGDLLISWSATLGVYEWFGDDAWLNQHIFKVIFDKKEFDKSFFRHLISTVINKLDQEVHGSTMKHITKKRFDEIQIPFPDLPTQQKIAGILDKADTLRQYNKQLIEKYDALTQSLFLEMFGDPVRNEKGWKIKTIGDMIDFLTSGSRGWAKYYSDKGDLFLRIQNVGYNKLRLDDLCFIDTPNTAEAKRTKVIPGDIIMSITADLGRTAVIPENFPAAFINQHLAILRLSKDYNPNYVSAFIASSGGQTLFNKLNKGGVKSGLNFNDIKSYSVFCPPIHLQNQFALRVQHIEQQKQQAQEALAKSESLFQSLLQRAFKGELK